MTVRSLPHDSAHTHVTGQSEFIDDQLPRRNEAFVEVFYSTEAHAEIRELDLTGALTDPETLGVYTYQDLDHNRWGTIFQDQPLLADKEVHFVGEPIAIVASRSREGARRARSLIQVKYNRLPAILSIQVAKQQQSFIGAARQINRGEVDSQLSSAPQTLSGKLVIRGADHFYLESQASLVIPKEDGQLEVHTSAQHPTEVQHVIAHALGLPSADITCVVKRMGGGFGGKESQAAPFAAYAALVARRLNRPARLILTKDDDMIMTGKRNPFEIDYQVGFDSQGNLLALDIQLFSDGGAYADLSTSIMERAMLHCDNAYFVPHLRVTGQVCRTHFHPHTAFRGFGGPKGVAVIEHIIEEVAHQLGLDPLDVRKRNCYTDTDERNTTHYGQKVENNCLPRLFDELERSSDYRARRHSINEHNQIAIRDSLCPLRGISLTAVKFGISFTTRFLNQANALVLVHRDGSLQVSTGATEMGQGVNARIATLVASELGLERHRVRLTPTSTDKNANTSPTAASSGTDLNGAAALIATRKIKARLSSLAAQLFKLPKERWAKNTAGLGTEPELSLPALPESLHSNQDSNVDADWDTGIATYHDVIFEAGSVYRRQFPDQKISFPELVHEAYYQRVSLSDYAHYKIPHLSFNKLTGKGEAFLYFTQGVACSEVSIDQITGETKVQRVDILMDLGRPINRDLDLGQVTGAFVQGMGWVTTEKLFYSNTGALLTHAPSTYKIPSIQDTPRVFNVELLSNDENRVNVRGTKAVGEPPLLLALSVWTAIENACASFRKREEFPRLEIPATQEQVLRALQPEKFLKWEAP